MGDKNRAGTATGADESSLAIIDKKPKLKLKQQLIRYSELKNQRDQLATVIAGKKDLVNKIRTVEIPQLELQQDTLDEQLVTMEKDIRGLAEKEQLELPKPLLIEVEQPD
jgi:hypothetical protein